MKGENLPREMCFVVSFFGVLLRDATQSSRSLSLSLSVRDLVFTLVFLRMLLPFVDHLVEDVESVV